MIAQHAHHRHAHAFLLLDRLLERGRLLDAQSHIQAHEYQQRTGEKRNAPAEIEELRVAQCFRQQQEHAAGADEAERRAQLGEHAVPGALARWCVLGGEQYRAAPFTAPTQALTEEIGRATGGESVRPYVYIWGVAVTLKKTNN